MLVGPRQLGCYRNKFVSPFAKTLGRPAKLATATITEASPAVKRQKVESATDQRGMLPQKLSVAPMMDWTDVHYRQLARCISKHTWLYTEMVVDQTVLYTDRLDKYLWFPEAQHPIVCQLGGSNPETLAKAAVVVAKYGYDEINLNCGCPSDRVAGAGCFGASLMLNPELVARCCAAVREATGVPMTVKCRIGVDQVDSYEALCRFIHVVAEQGGITHFIIHARKCILKGLSPAQNRTIPPLRRGWVFALARDFPHLDFSLNGVVEGCHEAAAVNAYTHQGARTHGVMIGRAAYSNPWHCLADADRAVFGEPTNTAKSRRQVLSEYAKYADGMLGKWGTKRDGSPAPGVKTLVKPLLGLLHGERGTKLWKQAMDRLMLQVKHRPDMTVSQLVEEASRGIPSEVLDAPPKELPAPSVAVEDVPERPATWPPGSAMADAVDCLNAEAAAPQNDREGIVSQEAAATPQCQSEPAQSASVSIASDPQQALVCEDGVWKGVASDSEGLGEKALHHEERNAREKISCS